MFKEPMECVSLNPESVDITPPMRYSEPIEC